MNLLVKQGSVAPAPKWLEIVRRNPPLDLISLQKSQRSVRNPYKRMVARVLKTFSDVASDGNATDASHQAMQFAAHQLSEMNRGQTENDAFGSRLQKFRNYKRSESVGGNSGMEESSPSARGSVKEYAHEWRTRAMQSHLEQIVRRLRTLRSSASGNSSLSNAKTDLGLPPKSVFAPIEPNSPKIR